MRFNIFPLVQADAAVQSVLGADVRLYPFGEAPQEKLPPDQIRDAYATWQTISGLPENYLADGPDIDHFRIQFDVWAPNSLLADSAADALRNALEPHGHQVSINMDGRDAEARLYRISFDFEFWVSR